MKKQLRIVFIGTPDFAVASLKSIYESGRNVVAVITAPDKKAGRGRQLRASAVKEYAMSKEIPLLQPNNLKAPSFIEELKSFKADLQIVVAFRMLPEIVWNMPKLGTFNLHASLLPNYRGAAPINWAIINGEKETGVSTFFLKHKIDTGDLFLQEKVTIEQGETAGSLHDKLMNTGAGLVLKSLDLLEKGDYSLIQQEEMLNDDLIRKEAPKIFKEDCKIDWTQSAETTDRLIRGMSPFPTAWTRIRHKESGKQLGVKIYYAEVVSDKISEYPGGYTTDEKGLKIQCGQNSLLIKEIQIEGKKRMNIKELLNGFKIEDYELI